MLVNAGDLWSTGRSTSFGSNQLKICTYKKKTAKYISIDYNMTTKELTGSLRHGHIVKINLKIRLQKKHVHYKDCKRYIWLRYTIISVVGIMRVNSYME